MVFAAGRSGGCRVERERSVEGERECVDGSKKGERKGRNSLKGKKKNGKKKNVMKRKGRERGCMVKRDSVWQNGIGMWKDVVERNGCGEGTITGCIVEGEMCVGEEREGVKWKGSLCEWEEGQDV